MTALPRPEYPRPQFRRRRWHNLNGEWAFAFDDDDEGLERSWPSVTAEQLRTGDGPLDLRIVVPFVYQSARSGIADSALREVLWYARTFDDVREDAAGRLLLHLGAVHYRATVWVNGRQVAQHEGGQTPFGADVTHAIEPNGNVLVVRVEDPHTDLTIPRGKRYWHAEPAGIFYPPSSGIWQTVWLEPVPALHLADSLRLSGDIDAAELTLAAEVDGPHEGASLRVQVRFIYGDDDNYVKLAHASIFETRQTEFAKELSPAEPEGFEKRYGNTVVGPPGEWTWLRIAKQDRRGEQHYTAYTSLDGSTWVRGGTWTQELGSDPLIGLVSLGGTGFTAEFDYVRVSRLRPGTYGR